MLRSSRRRSACQCQPPRYDGGIRNISGDLSFLSFSRLMEAAPRSNESICRTSWSNSIVKPSHTPMVEMTRRKKSVSVILEKRKGTKPSNSNKPPFEKRKLKEYPVLPLFRCGAKKLATLLKHWVKDQVIRLPLLDHFPSLTN